jgi:pseudouridine synthase
MRLQRALAQAGIASRRAAERLIEAGRVRVDGEVAPLGSKVDPERQTITVNGRRIRAQARRWLAFHKPLGVVTTASDEAGRRTVFEFIRDPAGLAYVGRLDVNTTGLLLLTNDGEAVHRLTHPRYRIPRHYTALVHGRPLADIVEAVKRRVLIDGRPVVTSDVRVRAGREGRSILDVTLAEGRHHIVRRWCEALGLRVDRLARTSYGAVRLGDLEPGKWRVLTEREIGGLYRAVGL